MNEFYTHIASFTLYSHLTWKKLDGTDGSMHRHLVFEVRDYSGIPNVVFRYFVDGKEIEDWNHQGARYDPTKRHSIQHGRWMWNDFVSKDWQMVKDITSRPQTAGIA